MSDMLEDLPHDLAQQLEHLSRLAFDLRERRKHLLQRHGAESEEALLQLVSDGAIAEQPACQDLLDARVLAETREAVRDQMKMLLAGKPVSAPTGQ